jgi:hypothetical protein
MSAAFGPGCDDFRMAGKGVRERRDLGEVVRNLSPEVLHGIVASAADRHDDVERHVRLAAAREEG